MEDCEVDYSNLVVNTKFCVQSVYSGYVVKTSIHLIIKFRMVNRLLRSFKLKPFVGGIFSGDLYLSAFLCMAYVML